MTLDFIPIGNMKLFPNIPRYQKQEYQQKNSARHQCNHPWTYLRNSSPKS